MLRYVLGSLILHVLVFSALLYRSRETIHDPIVAVSLDLNQPPQLASRPPRPQAVSAGPSLKPSENLPAVATETPNAAQTAETSPYDSGNVSVKPRVLKSQKIPYPQEAKDARVEGAVKLAVIVNENGTVQKVSVLESPGHGLGEAAEAALLNFVFSPAEVQGKKVSVQIVYVYRFRLESR